MEIVKERVEEMKNEEGWRKAVVDKYNEPSEPARSQGSAVSIRSYESNARERMEKEREKRSDWDSSTRVGDKGIRLGEEDQVAKMVADQILQDHPQLKGVHSNASVRRMLE
jgi:hypothetical protein